MNDQCRSRSTVMMQPLVIRRGHDSNNNTKNYRNDANNNKQRQLNRKNRWLDFRQSLTHWEDSSKSNSRHTNMNWQHKWLSSRQKEQQWMNEKQMLLSEISKLTRVPPSRSTICSSLSTSSVSSSSSSTFSSSSLSSSSLMDSAPIPVPPALPARCSSILIASSTTVTATVTATRSASSLPPSAPPRSVWDFPGIYRLVVEWSSFLLGSLVFFCLSHFSPFDSLSSPSWCGWIFSSSCSSGSAWINRQKSWRCWWWRRRWRWCLFI